MFIDQALHDANAFPESLWGKSVIWSDILLPIKARIEQLTRKEYKTCVCIYYPNGLSGVGYHSDYRAFGDTSVIPSLSIGEEREFCLREKSTMEEHRLLLKQGSLLIMGENCQERYEHSLPVDPSI